MHHTIGILGLISAIAFAFGERVARAIVGSALIIAALAFVYIMVRIINGSI